MATFHLFLFLFLSDSFIFISFTYSEWIAHIVSFVLLTCVHIHFSTHSNKNVGAVRYLKNAGVHRASAAKSLVKLIKAQGDE